MNKFVIRIQDATLQKGVVNKLVGNVTLKSFPELVTHSQLDANPRKAKSNPVTRAITETLEQSPELFQNMSKGLLYAAHSVRELDRSRYEITVENSAREGVLDGGHNTLGIGCFILKQTGYKDFVEIKKWDDLKEHWEIHQDEINSKKALLPDVLIPIEIVFPAEGSSGLDDFEASILQISAARNNNAQLKETDKANASGLYAVLKESVDEELSPDIKWREGEEGRIQSADVVALSLIALAALPSKDYPVVDALQKNPAVLFSSKGQCVQLYNDFMEQDGVSAKVEGDRTTEIVDAKVISALTLIKDIPKLFDRLHAQLPYAYNAVSSGFGRILSVRTLDADKWKADKKAYMRTPAKTKFYHEESNWSVPEGFVYPLVVSLTELIEVRGKQVRWSKDPYEFIEKHLEFVLRSGYQSMIRGQNYDPAKVGKEKGAYQMVRSLYSVADKL